jgi:hypothetical protein
VDFGFAVGRIKFYSDCVMEISTVWNDAFDGHDSLSDWDGHNLFTTSL